jgi:co-chaperonin GroES (HSP10)
MLPKGKKISDLVFSEEHVDPQVKLNIRGDNIYVQLAEKDDKVGGVLVPGSAAQRTRFGIIEAMGPKVNLNDAGESIPEEERLSVGDVVAIQFHVGSWLNAPAFGFRDQSHVICKSHAVMFTMEDK